MGDTEDLLNKPANPENKSEINDYKNKAKSGECAIFVKILDNDLVAGKITLIHIFLLITKKIFFLKGHTTYNEFIFLIKNKSIIIFLFLYLYLVTV